MRMRGAILVLAMLLVMPLVSSAVLIEDDFRNEYSVGDKVELKFSVSSNSVVSDFVDSYLECDGKSKLIDKRYVFLDDEVKDFTLEFPVMSEGECQFEVEFRNEGDVSEVFDISDKIDVSYELNGKFFFPGEEILLNGTAEKANGDNFDGVIEMEIDSLVSKTSAVTNGKFSFVYVVSEKANPKEYNLKLSVEELDEDDEVLNSGKSTEKITIKSKPTSISIDTVDHFQPPYNLTFKLKLLNQVGELIENESIITKIMDYDNSLIYQEEVVSDEDNVFLFSGETKKGSAYLNAYYGGLHSVVPIYVEDYEAVSTSIIGNVLRFTNVGNVEYVGIVDFEIVGADGPETMLLNITVPLGGFFDYGLEYSGTYNITSEGRSFFNAQLTGAAILGEGGVRTSSIIVVIFFTVILIFGYFFVRKKRKEHFPPKETVEGTPEMYHKIKDEIKTRKVFVKESPEEKVEPKRDVYMLFIKSVVGIEGYSGLVEKYGSRLHIVDDELGYVVFYGLPNVDSDQKLYKLAKNIKKFSKAKDDNMSLVLNKGFFEKKITLLKKFALINKNLLHAFPGKVVVGDKLMQRVGGHENFREEVVNVDSRRMKVWTI